MCACCLKVIRMTKALVQVNVGRGRKCSVLMLEKQCNKGNNLDEIIDWILWLPLFPESLSSCWGVTLSFHSVCTSVSATLLPSPQLERTGSSNGPVTKNQFSSYESRLLPTGSSGFRCNPTGENNTRPSTYAGYFSAYFVVRYPPVMNVSVRWVIPDNYCLYQASVRQTHTVRDLEAC